MNTEDEKLFKLVDKAVNQYSKSATTITILALSELLAHVQSNKTLTLDEFVRYTNASPSYIRESIKAGVIRPIVYPDYKQTHEMFFDREEGDKLIDMNKKEGFLPDVLDSES
ncbi:hypothetical protein [Lactococcus lactis]|jgi:hypothetical protein|uniref:hypothetical protein n=1 Tax=Lactococcus lactis TaxID=1358 RepID=UPI002890336A|nr:hypothetical protein [Lactococcus lactis]MDT2909333.1 hypothetical protein [Lactococcus lactis]MDT2925137.1 hypothetical protein [Lactococcus lactis]MDT2951996.1 hypothetical protein [Lactococcus lactis]